MNSYKISQIESSINEEVLKLYKECQDIKLQLTSLNEDLISTSVKSLVKEFTLVRMKGGMVK